MHQINYVLPSIQQLNWTIRSISELLLAFGNNKLIKAREIATEDYRKKFSKQFAWSEWRHLERPQDAHSGFVIFPHFSRGMTQSYRFKDVHPKYMHLNVSIRNVPFSKVEMRTYIFEISHFETNSSFKRIVYLRIAPWKLFLLWNLVVG